MRLILFVNNTEAAELLEAASEKSYVSHSAYEKLRGAIENVTTDEEFKTIASYAAPSVPSDSKEV